VATYPDRPYLRWSFTYEDPQRPSGQRNNDETFLEGCRQLHAMFGSFLELAPDYADYSGTEFAPIEDRTMGILQTQEDKYGRIAAWQQVAKSGDLFAGKRESIPLYKPWHDEWGELAYLHDSSEALTFSLYRYFQAASTHRNFVLRHLLPAHSLVVQ
jgi:hypothetical protein